MTLKWLSESWLIYRKHHKVDVEYSTKDNESLEKVAFFRLII